MCGRAVAGNRTIRGTSPRDCIVRSALACRRPCCSWKPNDPRDKPADCIVRSALACRRPCCSWKPNDLRDKPAGLHRQIGTRVPETCITTRAHAPGHILPSLRDGRMQLQKASARDGPPHYHSQCLCASVRNAFRRPCDGVCFRSSALGCGGSRCALWCDAGISASISAGPSAASSQHDGQDDEQAERDSCDPFGMRRPRHRQTAQIAPEHELCRQGLVTTDVSQFGGAGPLLRSLGCQVARHVFGIGCRHAHLDAFGRQVQRPFPPSVLLRITQK